jgi:hypothetical protein
VDPSSLDISVEPARPWTPSYSVHSQGSPLHRPSAIEPILSHEADDQMPAVDVPDLPEIRFADNRDIAVSNNLGSSEPTTTHHVDNSAEPLTGAGITIFVKDVPSNSYIEEPVTGLEEPVEGLDVDMSSHAESTGDVNHELEAAPQIPKLVFDDVTEVSLNLMFLVIFDM